jgi:mono/diheme cytochrome c family protein
MRRGGSFIGGLSVALVAVASCAQEEYPEALWLAQHPAATASDGGTSVAAAPVAGPLYCRQAHAESLPARLVAMSANAPPSATVVLVSDLDQEFVEVCGACHGPSVDPPGNGGFQIIQSTDFSSLMTASVLQHVTNSVCPTAEDPTNPNDPMPPCASPDGATYSQRLDSDPIKQFAELVGEWLQAGSPSSFSPGGDAGPGGEVATAQDAGAASAYVLTPQAGNAMTNIGNCIPSAAMVGIDVEKSTALDAMFASLTAQASGSALQVIGLPQNLSQTDLFTLDSQALAQEGVLAYAPGYPLWSDDAGKLRHVRVPHGQSIRFNKTTQQFEIPPNTRFYKTFMKEIIDTDGSYRYRKIETRLIVSRPDQNNPDGTAAAQKALFGSYLWNADETDAELVQTPLNDGEPFADTLLLYNTDEPLAADILSGQPADPQEQLLENGAARHYAIPSSPRCIQCHMGSASQAFVLGFTPLQINRRPAGVSGVIEATGPDELTQLQRFIDAGIITGIDSIGDVLPLEESQGARAPRNGYELTAQGYVLGNCSHCHNPRGYPSVENPVLTNVLDFLPGPTGGLFQFPLESYSPRIGRGLTGTTPIPYITPSLVDLPKLDPNSGGQAADWFVSAGAQGTNTVDYAIYAPWRSIIYRNVDAAFAYTDDFALFPHMPMNTPGYDPRAKQILADWMVSIPSVRKQPEIPEYAYRTDGAASDNVNGPVVDTTPQPYVEVLPGAPAYNSAVIAAQQRLAILHTGVNPAVALASGGVVYSKYADRGQTGDIIDPEVTADPICHPIPVGEPDLYFTPLPEHPDWVVTDLTEPPGAWAPRQPNWPQVLVEGQVPPQGTACTGLTGEQAAYADQIDAVQLLPSVTLDQVRAYVTAEQPFGLWQEQASCNFSSQPTVSSFTGAQRPHWMDVTNPPPDAPVYMETPGEAIFKMICINCHGPDGAADGRMAQNLATMTGGNARVADFRDGLFGPVGAAEDMSNRQAVFGITALHAAVPDASANWAGDTDAGIAVTDDDRAARYMAWMGLGGTSVNIPVAILEIVAITQVLDQVRTLAASSLSANMLSETKALCLGLFGPGFADAQNGEFFDPTPGHGYLDAKLTHLNDALIPENGDAELWLNLCSMANPAPVHLLQLDPHGLLQLTVATTQDSQYDLDIQPQSLVAAANYPAGAPVGDEGANVQSSLQPTNLWPWCVDNTAATAAQSEWLQSNSIPVCAASVIAAGQGCAANPTAACFGNDAANQWAVRGAINAGMSVFLYLESIENSGPPPDYNQCNLLN